MGKIVKYCAVCEESFAEKFSFCPNCAGKLSAYEMNPLMPEAKTEESPKVFEPVEDFSAPATLEMSNPQSNEDEPQTPTFLNNSSFESNDDFLDIEEEKVEEPFVAAPTASFSNEVIEEDEEPVVTAPTVPVVEQTQNSYIPKTTPVYQQATASFADEKRSDNKKLDDDGFYSVTLVEEKDGGTRRMLLMGAFLLVMGGAFLSLIASVYNADAFVGALDDDLNSIVYVGEDIPPAEEPEMPEPKNNDKGGGGGGGGNKDPNPVSKGVLASQSEKPMIPPSAKMDKVTNPELVLKPETQGNRVEKPSNEKYGDPNSTYTVGESDGPGSGGGQGAGTGRGQGNGRGTGAGNGIGSGNGNGIGNGNGNGRGDGDNGDGGDPPPVIKKPVGPTEGLKILAKPRANYTDAARQNQVQGTVTLRVTFLANGSIGSISPVNGLPNGLTEQAIAAARGIRFEPAKVNGVAQTVTKQVQYSFTLY